MKKQFVALALAMMLGFTCQPVALAEETELNSTVDAKGLIIQQTLDEGVSVAGPNELETWGMGCCMKFLAEHGREIVNEARSIIDICGSVSQQTCVDFALGRLQECLVNEASAMDPAVAAQGWSTAVISTLIGMSVDDLNASNVIDTLFTALIKDWVEHTIGVELSLPEYYAEDIVFVNQLIRDYDLPADVASTDGGGVRMWIMSAFVEFDDSFPKRLKGIRIVVQNDNPAPLDMTGVSNLEWAYISGGNCSEISVKELRKLMTLEVRHANNLKKINADGCVALQSLFCDASRIEDLVVAHTPKLKKLEIPRHKISSLNLEGCPNLTDLKCTSGCLAALNVEALRCLKTLDCSGNQLKTLDVTKCGELEVLHAANNQLESVVLGSALKTLQEIDFSSNRFTEFNLNNGLMLEKLWLNDNPLERLRITNNSRLGTLQYGDSGKMRSVDIQGCVSLRDLAGSLKGEFTYLNIKNCISLDKPLSLQLSRRDGMSPAAQVVNVNGCTLKASCEDHNGMKMLYSVTIVPNKGTVVLNGNTLNPPDVEIAPSLPLCNTTSWYNKAKEFLLNQDCLLVMWYGNRATPTKPPAPSVSVQPTATATASARPTQMPSPSASPSAIAGPTAVPAPAIPAVTGYQGGRMNGRTYYAKTSGAGMLFYQKKSSGSLGRVSVPYVTAADGTRYYPINCGGTVLYPRLTSGKLSAYCFYTNGLEIPIVRVSASVSAAPGELQTFSLNGKTYFVRTSGASMMFYQKKSSGSLGRVSAPYVTDKTGTRYYPVNCGGTVLAPQLTSGTLSACVAGQVPVLVPVAQKAA